MKPCITCITLSAALTLFASHSLASTSKETAGEVNQTGISLPQDNPVRIVKDTLYRSIFLKAGSDAFFWPNGGLRSGVPKNPTTFQSIQFAAGKKLKFYPDGSIESGHLLSDYTDGQITVPASSQIHFHKDGTIKAGSFTKGSSLDNGYMLKSQLMVNLDEGGRVTQLQDRLGNDFDFGIHRWRRSTTLSIHYDDQIDDYIVLDGVVAGDTVASVNIPPSGRGRPLVLIVPEFTQVQQHRPRNSADLLYTYRVVPGKSAVFDGKRIANSAYFFVRNYTLLRIQLEEAGQIGGNNYPSGTKFEVLPNGTLVKTTDVIRASEEGR